MSSKKNSLKYSYNKAYYEGTTITIVTGSADSPRSKQKKITKRQKLIFAIQLLMVFYILMFICTKDFAKSYVITKELLENVGYIGGIYFILDLIFP